MGRFCPLHYCLICCMLIREFRVHLWTYGIQACQNGHETNNQKFYEHALPKRKRMGTPICVVPVNTKHWRVVFRITNDKCNGHWIQISKKSITFILNKLFIRQLSNSHFRTRLSLHHSSLPFWQEFRHFLH